MPRPNLIDKLKLRFNPHYLYPGQSGQVNGKILASLVHKSPATNSGWKVMDHCYLTSGTIVRYLGRSGNNFLGQIPPHHSLFEVVKPVTEPNCDHDHAPVSTGDNIVLAPADCQYVWPIPD